MHIPKKYFQDRFILLLLSLNTFVALFSSVIILLRLDGGGKSDYFVQFRANQGLDSLQRGGMVEILSFIAFAAFVLGFHTLLSIKVYTARRHFAAAVLGLGLFLLTFMFYASNALLNQG